MNGGESQGSRVGAERDRVSVLQVEMGRFSGEQGLVRFKIRRQGWSNGFILMSQRTCRIRACRRVLFRSDSIGLASLGLPADGESSKPGGVFFLLFFLLQFQGKTAGARNII